MTVKPKKIGVINTVLGSIDLRLSKSLIYSAEVGGETLVGRDGINLQQQVIERAKELAMSVSWQPMIEVELHLDDDSGPGYRKPEAGFSTQRLYYAQFDGKWRQAQWRHSAKDRANKSERFELDDDDPSPVVPHVVMHRNWRDETKEPENVVLAYDEETWQAIQRLNSQVERLNVTMSAAIVEQAKRRDPASLNRLSAKLESVLIPHNTWYERQQTRAQAENEEEDE